MNSNHSSNLGTKKSFLNDSTHKQYETNKPHHNLSISNNANIPNNSTVNYGKININEDGCY